MNEFNLDKIKEEFEASGKWKIFIKDVHMDEMKLSGMTAEYGGVEFTVIDISGGSYVPYEETLGYLQLATICDKYNVGWYGKDNEKMYRYFYFK